MSDRGSDPFDLGPDPDEEGAATVPTMEERIRRLGRTAWWFVGITAAAVVVLVLIWQVRVVIPPLLLAGVIVFLLNPIVVRLHRRGIPRVLGTTVAYVGVALSVVAIGLALRPVFSNQIDQLREKWPEIRADVEDQVDEWSVQSEENDWVIKIPSVDELEGNNDAADDDPATREEFTEQVQTVRKWATRVFHVGLIFVLGPIVAFYLLIDLPDVRRRIEELIPAASREEVLFLGHRLNLVVGGFLRGQLAVAFIVGVLSSIGLRIIDLPLWLFVGMIAGIFNMIPLIGPYIGAVPGIVIALATKDLKAAIGVAVVMTVVQQIDNHFITPTVMKRAVQLHPAAVMMSLLAFGTLGGFFGLLIAVPATAVLKVVGGHLWRKYVMGISVPGLDHSGSDRLSRPPEEALLERTRIRRPGAAVGGDGPDEHLDGGPGAGPDAGPDAPPDVRPGGAALGHH